MGNNSKGSLMAFLVVPVLLIVQLLIGLDIYRNIRHAAIAEAGNNSVELYLRTNTKYIGSSESAQRAYLLTGADKYEEIYNTALAELKKNNAYYDSLPEIVKRNEIDAIQGLSRQRLALEELTMQLYKNGNRDSASNIVKAGYGQILTDSIRSTSTLLRQQLSAEIASEKEQEDKLLAAFLITIAVLIVISLLAVWFSFQSFKQHNRSLQQTITALEKVNGTMLQCHLHASELLHVQQENITGALQAGEGRGKPLIESGENKYMYFLNDAIKQQRSIIAEMRARYYARTDDGPKPGR